MKYVRQVVKTRVIKQGRKPGIIAIIQNLNWKKISSWTLKIIAVMAAVLALLFLYVARNLPDPNRLLDRTVPESTKIYARDGSILYEVHGEVKRTLIPFDQMNDFIKNATVAIEDKNFYQESGINLKGILRSLWVDLTRGSLSQGGSTITQQFVRNAILTRDKTFSRKIKEIILSLEINERFSKNDVLKLYLNEIPYGRNAYGIEAGARAYFGKHARDLDLAEAAYLAALPQAPSLYSPSGSHRADLDSRKNTVLDQMLAQGYISKDQRNQAKSETVKFTKSGDPIIAPHFVIYIEDYITTKYGEQALQNGGLQITTTLDPRLQDIAEKVIKDAAPANEKNNRAYNEALVAMDPKTGQILAMVGSKDYFGESEPAGCKPELNNCRFVPNFNIATDGVGRQPGSSGKPYVYATAFKPEFKQSPASMRVDVVTDFGTYGNRDYIPHNFLNNENGPVSIRKALAGSLNIPAVKTLAMVGVTKAVQTMHDFGITTPLKDCGLSLVLGGCEVHLLDHVSGFSTIATEGIHHPSTGILKIQDSSGRTLEEFQDQPQQVLDPQSAFELINIMTDNSARAFIFGAKSPLILADRPVAAKTGTTQNFHDGWTLGFTPSLAAGVWAGNNDGTLLRNNADGVVVAAPIWHNFMQQALAGTPPEAFAEPAGIQHVVVDAISGLLPTQYTPSTKTETFASFSVPTEHDNVHVAVTTTDPATGQTTQTVCAVLHSERPSDSNWEQPVQNWAAAHASEGYCSGGMLPVGAAPGGTVPTGAVLPSSTPGNNPGNGNNNGQTNSSTPQGSPPDVKILYPLEKATVSLPFMLQAVGVPDTGNTIIRADLLIDGTISQSLTSSPYNFSISQLSAGLHAFAVHMVDDKNNSADTSITIKIK